jgi:hypothetical protein
METPGLMEMLSEDRIKKAGLRFLKTYYRQRERSGGGANTVSYDVETEGGIIVDVLLSFLTPQGKPFRAALEATSKLSKEEVTYHLQKNLLFWDSFAAGSILTALLFGYSFAFKHFTIHQIGIVPTVLLLVMLMALLVLLISKAVGWRNRYQYIYAIEQFKKYHVDEQWIAVGFDVFEHPEDELLLELREQCVINGFGLVEINADEEARVLITPSRKEIFGKERVNLAFERRDSAAKKGLVTRYSKVWNNSLTDKLKAPVSKQIKRYELGYVRQALLSGFAFLAIGGIFHRQLQDREFDFIDEADYTKSMLQFGDTTFAELEEYVLDSAALAPIIKEEPGYLETIINNNELTEELLGVDSADRDLDYASSDLPPLEIEAVPDDAFDVIVVTESGNQFRYGCERLSNLHGRYFLVLENIYTNAGAAQKRLARLSGADIPVNAFSMSCFLKGDQRYLVYYDLFYDDEKETGQALRKFRKMLKAGGFSNKHVKTYSLTIGR